MDFNKLCVLFSMKEPYYGIILSSMQRHEVNNIPTIAVGKDGNVFSLYYNKQFIESQTTEAAMEILKHEVLHVCFCHFSAWEEATTDPQIENRRNMAADLEVNCYINLAPLEHLSPCSVDKFGFDKQLGCREYYKKLREMEEQQKKNQTQVNTSPNVSDDNSFDDSNPSNQSDTSGKNSKPNVDSSNLNESDGQSQGNSPFGGYGKGFDDHSHWPKSDKDSDGINKMFVEELLLKAADECEKSRGLIPSEMKQLIETARARKAPKPVCDWKRYLRRFIGNEFTEETRRSKKRESHRFPDAAGIRRKRKSNILVAIDTSGSISMPEYNKFFGQILTLTDKATFDVVECDARIQHQYRFIGQIHETVHGGGGTDFTPVIDLFTTNRRHYDNLIYFTDGEAPMPKNAPKGMLWALTADNTSSTRKKFTANGMFAVFIKK